MLNKYFLSTLIFTFFLHGFAKSLFASGSNWSAAIFYVSEIKINVYESPSNDSKVIGHSYFLDKLLIVDDPAGSGKFGWKKVVYPLEGYVEDKYLVTMEERSKRYGSYWYNDEDENATWKWEIRTCSNQYTFVRKHPDYQSQITGVIMDEEKVLIVIDTNGDNKIWTKVLYPYDGYISSEDISEVSPNIILSFGGAYGIKNIPYEKNFTNLKSPFGGFLELSKTNWKFSIRAGYSYSESNISKYDLKTRLIYVFIRYNFFSLFNAHLNYYVFAGGCYWYSSFQNTKYPSLESTYYPLEKDKGPGYLTGGGLTYELYNFFIDAQYFFFGSRQAVFGRDPRQGEFTNQYKLYPASNLVNVMIGYRIIF